MEKMLQKSNKMCLLKEKKTLPFILQKPRKRINLLMVQKLYFLSFKTESSVATHLKTYPISTCKKENHSLDSFPHSHESQAHLSQGSFYKVQRQMESSICSVNWTGHDGSSGKSFLNFRFIQYFKQENKNTNQSLYKCLQVNEHSRHWLTSK